MLGEFLAVLTALLWAVSTILSARALRDMNPIRANMLRTLFSALTMPFISLALGEFNEISNIDSVSLLFVIVAAIIAITFRTSLFLYGAGTAFIYTLITGIRTKSWRTTIKDATLLLAATLTLIYLRTL